MRLLGDGREDDDRMTVEDISRSYAAHVEKNGGWTPEREAAYGQMMDRALDSASDGERRIQ